MKRLHEEPFTEITFYPSDFIDLEANPDDDDNEENEEPKKKRRRSRSRKKKEKNQNDDRKFKSVLQIRDDNKVSQIACLPVDEDEDGNPTPFVPPEEWKTKPPSTPQEYLLRVRYEAQHLCEQTVVAHHIDPRAYDSNVTIKVPEIFHEFEPFMKKEGINTIGEVDIHAPKDWIEDCLRTFCLLRNKTLRDKSYIDEDGVDESTKAVLDTIPQFSDWNEWKLFCFGGERREKTPKTQTEEKKVNDNHLKEFSQESKEDMQTTDEVTIDDEEKEQIQDDIEVYIQETEIIDEKDDQDITNEISMTSNENPPITVEPHEPTEQMLYCLDYITTIGLLHRFIRWIMDEKIINRIRFMWLYAILLILDNPAPPNSAAALNEFLRWLLEKRALIASGKANRDDLAYLNTLITIIVMVFSQGDKAVV
jgi:hypothetical protein